MTREIDVLMRSVDENNDSVIAYPQTKKNNIIDLEEASSEDSGLMSSSDKAKLDNINYIFGRDDNGIYLEFE